MCYSAIAVANYFIEKSIEKKHLLTPSHITNLIFFAHAVYLKANNKLLFSDPVIAGVNGPTITSVEDGLKHYGESLVDSMILSARPMPEGNGYVFQLVTPKIRKDDTETRDFLKTAWDKLSGIESWRLRMYSTEEGGSWYETVKDKVNNPKDKNLIDQLPRNLTILDEVIKRCGR